MRAVGAWNARGLFRPAVTVAVSRRGDKSPLKRVAKDDPAFEVLGASRVRQPSGLSSEISSIADQENALQV
jgi:hypothetical protein